MSESVYQAILRSKDKSRRYKERRHRQLRRRCLEAMGAALFTVIFAVSCHTILSEAKESSEPFYKYYTSIEIPYGTTLWEIAETYCGEGYDSTEDYLHEIMEINHLQEERVIRAGNHLIIPYFSTELKQ